MNNLLKINYETEQPTVSARDLHEQLHIETPFKKWIDRMCDYGFEVGNGTIGEECALRIVLMNENDVAVDLSITDDGAYLSEFYALTEDMIPRTYED